MTRETAFHSSFARHTRQFYRIQRLLAGQLLQQGKGRSRNTGPAARKRWSWTSRRCRKFEVTGPDAEALLQYTLTRDVKKLGVGQVVYSAMCYEHGGMIDDGTVLRLGKNNFRWIGGDDYSGIWLRQTSEKLGLKALVRSSTDQTAQHRRAGAEEPRHPQGDHLDARRSSRRLANWNGSALPSGASAIRRRSGRGLAHRLHRRARLRDLLPSAGCAKRVRRGVGGRRSRTAYRRWA